LYTGVRSYVSAHKTPALPLSLPLTHICPGALALVANPSIRALQQQHWHLTDETQQGLAAALAVSSSLQALNISGTITTGGDETSSIILEALAKNTSLESLHW
jgi:hypothetical protein